MRKSVKLLLSAAIAMTAFLTVGKVDSKAAVTNVKQTDGGKNNIALSWNAELGENISYAVQLSNDGKNWATVDTTSHADSSISNLTAGRTYYARVGAFNCNSWDINSNSVPISGWSSAAEMVTAPDTSKIKAVQCGATTNSISVKVSGVSGANNYFIQYNDSVIGKSKKSTIKTSTKLSVASSYYIKVYAARRSSTGFNAYSSYGYDSLYGKTLTNAIGAKSFGVTSALDNINVYYFGVSVSGSYDGTQMQFATPNGKVKKNIYGGSSYRIENFINGTFYKYRVRTYVECGSKKVFSKWSSYHYIGVSKETKGTSYKNYRHKYQTIRVNWSKLSGASSFDIYISNRENSGYKKVKTISAKTRKITITKYGKSRLKVSTSYYVKIVPKAKIGKKTVKSEITYVLHSY